ncbi:Ig-like domain-containing protein, partial [Singulisphaera acidiphila]
VAYDRGPYNVVHDQTIDNSLYATDEDAGDLLTYSLVANASHGYATVGPDSYFAYTPYPGYVGTDSFTYVANDGLANSNVATVTINVTNAPPVARDAGVFTTEVNGSLDNGISTYVND